MKLLDLFSGAGGAGMGYWRAGFQVVGVDLEPQPHYPFEFHRADALDVLDDLPDGFDAIHASPPCQAYSNMSNCRPGLADTYPDLIAQTRAALEKTGLPYVIENVPGSPLREDLVLCGCMVGLDLYRPRVFESNVPLPRLRHPMHTRPGSKAGHWTPGTIISVAGHFAPMAEARRAMGINWMNRAELGEAIPPAFTQYVGTALLRAPALAR